MEIPASAFFITAFISLFTIVNPTSTLSVFLSLTRGESRVRKILIARKATLISASLLIIFALLGTAILDFFSITLEAFQIAGGILVAMLGLKMINSGKEHLPTKEEQKDAKSKDDISIIPLAIPMLSGPGALTTAIVIMGHTENVTEVGALMLAIILVALASFILLIHANLIDRFMGESMKKVLDKMMGLIVLVIGVQFIVNGSKAVLVTWGMIG